jgi:hypothetical protein
LVGCHRFLALYTQGRVQKTRRSTPAAAADKFSAYMAMDFRSAVTSAARKVFAPKFPEYHEIAGVHDNALLLLHHSGASGINYFIMIGKRLEHDEFTVEAAWNVEDAYPRTVKMIRPAVSGVPTAEIMREPAGRFRVDRLWGARRDHWWRVGEEASIDEMLARMEKAAGLAEQGRRPTETAEEFGARIASELEASEPSPREIELAVPALVEDAARRTREFLIPYFEQVERIHSKG